jgi:hypothetical protein
MTCTWPNVGPGGPYYWSITWEDTRQNIYQYDDDPKYVRTYIYGYRLHFLDVDDGGQPECYLFTKTIDWSDIGLTSEPPGHSITWPTTTTCGGDMLVFRKLGSGDGYYFPL